MNHDLKLSFVVDSSSLASIGKDSDASVGDSILKSDEAVNGVIVA